MEVEILKNSQIKDEDYSEYLFNLQLQEIQQVEFIADNFHKILDEERDRLRQIECDRIFAQKLNEEQNKQEQISSDNKYTSTPSAFKNDSEIIQTPPVDTKPQITIQSEISQIHTLKKEKSWWDKTLETFHLSSNKEKVESSHLSLDKEEKIEDSHLSLDKEEKEVLIKRCTHKFDDK